jgi:hypothetical protein
MSIWDAVIPTITDVRDTMSIAGVLTGTDYIIPARKRWLICGFSAISSVGTKVGIVPCTDVGTTVNLAYFNTEGASGVMNCTRGVIGGYNVNYKNRKPFTPFEMIAGNDLYFDWYAVGAGEHIYTSIIYKELPL